MDHAKNAECAVCHQLFKEPKVLNCGHSFCKKCIKATQRGPTGQPKVACPDCRQESSEPTGGFPTNLWLQELVTKLESEGVRNAKECGGCGRKTPKEELFRCTACEEEPGNAQSVAICSLCCVKDQHAHCFVQYNKATQRDVDEARDKISDDGTASQEKVDVVLKRFPEMPQNVKQALKDRMQQHDELSAQLQVENCSKDDIAAKLAQSRAHKAETERILEQIERIQKEMTDAADRYRRSLMKLVQKKGPVSHAAAARPAATAAAADLPTTSADAGTASTSGHVTPAPRIETADEWEERMDRMERLARAPTLPLLKRRHPGGSN